MRTFSLAILVTVVGVGVPVEGRKHSSKRLRSHRVESTAHDENGDALVHKTRELLEDQGNTDWWLHSVAMSIEPTMGPQLASSQIPVPSPTSAPNIPLPPVTDRPAIDTSATPTATPAIPVTPTRAPVAPIMAPMALPPDRNEPGTPDGPSAPAIQLTKAPFPPTSGAIPTNRPETPPDRAPTYDPSSIAGRLQPFLIGGGTEFTDPNTYQSRALRRIQEQEGIDFVSDAKIVQYYALYSILLATDGVSNPVTAADPAFDAIEIPGWTNKHGWEETNRDPCTGWYGVVCLDDRVTELNLYGNGLSGVWPHEVTLLAADGPRGISGAGNLTKIDLFNNEFLFNDYDNSWMSLLGSAMEHLYFQNTAFAGSLAPLPVNLVEFDCSYTLIDGGLTNEVFSGLDSLIFAMLDGNAYNSSVPTVFSSLPNLEFLYISDAFISGDLSYMQGMPKLIEHWIDLNEGLQGTIPSSIGSITTLKSLSLSQSSLTGTLPTELGLLSNMIQMWFFDNFLEGQIPSELGLLSTMGILQIEGNEIQGTVPPQVCALREFPSTLEIFGSDCTLTDCTCCTCCDVVSCNPDLFF